MCGLTKTETSNGIMHTYPIEDFTDFVNEQKLFIALVLDGNEFHIRGSLYNFFLISLL